VIWIDCNPQAGRETRDAHPAFAEVCARLNQIIGLVEA